MLQRLNEEMKRRKRMVRIFPNTESGPRLIRALCVETHETWLGDNRYLNMALLAEHKNEQLTPAAYGPGVNRLPNQPICTI
jgi:transposase-like protein